jgi:hypothetical protein
MLRNLIPVSTGRAGCKLALLSSLALGLAGCGGGSDTTTGGGSTGSGGTGGGTTPAANIGVYKGNMSFTVNTAAAIPAGSDSIQFDIMSNGTVKFTDIDGGIEQSGSISGNEIKVTGTAPVYPEVASHCTPDTFNVTINAVVHVGKTITGNLVSSAVTCTYNGITATATLHGDINASKI